MRSGVTWMAAWLAAAWVGAAGAAQPKAPDDTYGKDWPMWARDEYRRQATACGLPETLHLQWRRDYRPTDSAWAARRGMGHRGTMLGPRQMEQYDEQYEPVVLGKRMYVGLNNCDALAALDTDSGAELWRFYTDGPIRTAPVALSSEAGAGPAAKVYVASDDGCVYALDAATGAVVWKKRAGPTDRKCFGRNRLISVWPVRCGPVATDGKVYFGSGMFSMEGFFWHALDAATGAEIWSNDSTGNNGTGGPPPSGNLAVSADRSKLLFNAGYRGPYRFDRATGAYLGGGGEQNCFFVTANGGRLSVWPVDVTAGGRQWTAADATALGVTGTVRRLLAADDKLFVVTGEGSVYCFGGSAVTPKIYPVAPTPLADVNDPWKANAARILSTTGADQGGCCLVLGVGSGRAVEELVRQSVRLHVVAVDPDATRIAALRARLNDAGLYGTRASAHVGNPMDWGIPPYVGRLIVSEDLNAAGFASGQAFVEAMYKHVRPYGGALWLATTAAQHASVSQWAKAAGLANAELTRDAEFSVLKRVGELPGAVNPNADGTVPASPDQLARAPFGVLWWDGQNNRTTAGFSRDGWVADRDAYTGLPGAASGSAINAKMPLLQNYGARTNALTDLPEARPKLDAGKCGVPVDWGNLMGSWRTVAGWYDRATESGFVRMWEGRGYCGLNRIPQGLGMSVSHGLMLQSLTWCGCYGVLTSPSVMLIHMPDAENWAAWGTQRNPRLIEEHPIKRMGVNFGAPGDRLEDDGTLWVDVPARNWAPMALAVTFTPDLPEPYYHHSSRIQGAGPKKWVTASGVVGATGIRIALGYPPVALRASSPPTVDGALSDACWDGREPVPLWSEVTPGAQRSNQRAFFRYDDQNLYVAFECPKISAGNGNNWRLHLADRGNLYTDRYGLHVAGETIFSVYPDGTRKVNDQPIASGDWTDAWSAAFAKDAATCRGEMAIPWTTLQAAGLWKEQLLVNPALAWASGSGKYTSNRDSVYLRAPAGAANQFCPLYFDTLKGLCGAARPYTVRLYFAEPDPIAVGQRVFDVQLQGRTVLSNFDIAQAAGGAKRQVVRQFDNVLISRNLEIGLVPRAGSPLICGAEIVGTYEEPVNAPPTAAVTASSGGRGPATQPDRQGAIVRGPAPLTVLLDGRGSVDPDGQFDQCWWNFGDGQGGKGHVAMEHTYYDPGDYVAVLRVADDRGAMSNVAGVKVSVLAGGPGTNFVCRIRSTGGDYDKLSDWEAAIQSDLTSSGWTFAVSDVGTFAAGDENKPVVFTGGGTGTLRWLDPAAMTAMIDKCAGKIEPGPVTIDRKHTFTVADAGTVKTSMVFAVANRGNYAPADDDGKTVTFAGGGTGMLKHINTENVAYIVLCAGRIGPGPATCASGHTFTVADAGQPVRCAVAECYNDWPTGLKDTVAIAGWLTDANHYVRVRVADGHEHRGLVYKAAGATGAPQGDLPPLGTPYSGFTLISDVNGAYALSVCEPYTRVEGLAVAGKAAAPSAKIGGFNCRAAGGPAFLDRLLVYRAGSGGLASIGCSRQQVRLSNSLVIEDQGGGGVVVYGGDESLVHNVTVVNGKGAGVSIGGRGAAIKNVLSSGHPAGKDFVSAGVQAECCASSDGTAANWGGSGNRVNQTFRFVNAAGLDFRLAPNDTGGAGLGVDLTFEPTGPVRWDIGKAPRAGTGDRKGDASALGTPWDIGAHGPGP